jgi:hypothetical protein
MTKEIGLDRPQVFTYGDFEICHQRLPKTHIISCANDDELWIPHHSLIGELTFTPNGKMDFDPRNRTYAVFSLIDGFRRYFSHIDYLREVNRKRKRDEFEGVPVALIGYTNHKMGDFLVRNLGFIEDRGRKNPFIRHEVKVVGETDMIRDAFQRTRRQHFPTIEKWREFERRARREKGR